MHELLTISYNGFMFIRRLGAFFLDIIQVVVFAVAIFLFVYLLILQPHKIKGISMMPNFPDGEYLLTDKVTYRFREPARGDVVVFEPPSSTNGEEYIKRIVGLPGETISIKEGFVYINGVRLEERYIPSDFITSNSGFLGEGQIMTIPSDEYFVLGDNRSHSSDSRVFGLIQKDKITGRAWLIYWPPQNAGKLKKAEYNI